MRPLVLSTPAGARHEERVWSGALAQDPPRTTRVRQPGLSQLEPSIGERR